ncbi:YfhO family protein [Patescibacteria group bacterium]|nr:YfhO family protein [Patescibacteria group bacterium]MBU1931219.1 YfhO family protein [Patescibacteria group bacterium]
MKRLSKKLYQYRYLFILGLAVVIFFYPVIKGKYPIPADALLGMYHPWRDQAWDGFVRFPFKNFLITDPVRQIYPYKQLVINQWKAGQVPSWNPYILAGMPLAASWQAGAFYPFNLVFLVLPFKLAWTVFIGLQPFLAALFMFFYLKNQRFKQLNCWLIALSWAFSGFMMAWLTWGNIGHTALWLPLILLSIDKKRYSVFIFALASAILAGHTQVAFYVSIFSILYLGFNVFVKKISSKTLIRFVLSGLIVACLTLPQWGPSLKLAQLSGRQSDLPNKGKLDWFLPGVHLTQLIAPDFFGNPATQNYWGVWNYAEFVSYIGIAGLLLAIYGLFFSQDKNRHFFSLTALLTLILATSNPISRLFLNVPFVGTFQPSRFVYLLDFSLLLLAGYGFQAFLTKGSVKKLFPFKLVFSGIICCLLFVLAFFLTLKPGIFQALNLEPNFLVSRRNLVLPTGLLLAVLAALFAYQLTKKRFILVGLMFLVVFDLFRFTHKFTPFVRAELIFPQTKTLDFLQQQTVNYPWRVAGVDYLTNQKRIFAPNLNMPYKLATPDGYEPLYLKRYGEFIGLLEWGDQVNLANLAFNRIIIPNNYNSRLFDLLGVKYILSLQDIDSPKLKPISQAGETRIYENTQSFPRAFLVYDYQVADSKQAAAEFLLDENIDLRKTVILEQNPGLQLEMPAEEKLEIVSYKANQVLIKTESETKALLILTDSYYPTWQALIDGQTTEIFMADYTFRAVVVPAGSHEIEFKNQLF